MLYFPELDVETLDGKLMNTEFLNGENMSLSNGERSTGTNDCDSYGLIAIIS